MFKILKALSNSVVRKQAWYITKERRYSGREDAVRELHAALRYHEHVLEPPHLLAKPIAGEGVEPWDICAFLVGVPSG